MNSYEIVHIVFDHYDKVTTLNSRHRSGVTKANIDVCGDSTPVRLCLDRFHCNNQKKIKHSLTLYLASKIMEHFSNNIKDVVVSAKQGASSNHRNVGHLSTNQDDANTIIFLHALEIHKVVQYCTSCLQTQIVVSSEALDKQTNCSSPTGLQCSYS